MQQAAAGEAASWDSHPLEDLSKPPHAVTRARRKYHCVRCLSSPYGWNHQPSEAKQPCMNRDALLLRLASSSASSSGKVLAEGVFSFQDSGGSFALQIGALFTTPSLIQILRGKIQPFSHKKSDLFTKSSQSECFSHLFGERTGNFLNILLRNTKHFPYFSLRAFFAVIEHNDSSITRLFSH